MTPVTRRSVSAIAIGFITCVPLRRTSAQGGVINDDQRRISIALSEAPESSESDTVGWHEIVEGIASDLNATGQFVLLKPNRMREPVNALPRFDSWRSANAQWLVTGQVRRLKHSIVVEARVWNVVKGEQLLGQQYSTASEEPLQGISHELSKGIVERLTGEQNR